MDAGIPYNTRSQLKLEAPITITTDFGTRDGFVAQMKGVILGINPAARIIDVTHEIEPFSIVEGALVLKGATKYFPAGTIHVAVVDPGVGSQRRGVAIRCRESMFVGPDNGLFSLVLGSDPREAREVTNPDYMLPNPHPTFHGRDVFAPVAAHLSRGATFESVGPQVNDLVQLEISAVRRCASGLDGEVIHVDRFGNLCSNIEAGMIDHDVRSVTVADRGVRAFGGFFGQVAVGQPIALINSFGYLEIAVNRGNAHREFGVGRGAPVHVFWA
ncbi:MAG: SAM-dependent chlorinase/fluorinase [Desulfomonile sp.]|nr:SAM-dependent chlorinase/fluorinase [Desulfomonile sp.]